MRPYDIMALDAIADDATVLPLTGGLYGIALIDVRVITPSLHRAGLALDAVGLGRLPFLYVAAASSLRADVAQHLVDDSTHSALRQTLGALLSGDLALTVKAPSGPQLSFDRDSETRLTSWMVKNLVVATLQSRLPVEGERRVITVDPDPDCSGIIRRAVEDFLVDPFLELGKIFVGGRESGVDFASQLCEPLAGRLRHDDVKSDLDTVFRAGVKPVLDQLVKCDDV